jgi:ankyrin repeat protein
VVATHQKVVHISAGASPGSIAALEYTKAIHFLHPTITELRCYQARLRSELDEEEAFYFDKTLQEDEMDMVDYYTDTLATLESSGVLSTLTHLEEIHFDKQIAAELSVSIGKTLLAPVLTKLKRLTCSAEIIAAGIPPLPKLEALHMFTKPDHLGADGNPMEIEPPAPMYLSSINNQFTSLRSLRTMVSSVDDSGVLQVTYVPFISQLNQLEELDLSLVPPPADLCSSPAHLGWFDFLTDFPNLKHVWVKVPRVTVEYLQRNYLPQRNDAQFDDDRTAQLCLGEFITVMRFHRPEVQRLLANAHICWRSQSLTCLAQAAVTGSFEQYQTLVELGADPLMITPYSHLPLSYGISGEHPTIALDILTSLKQMSRPASLKQHIDSLHLSKSPLHIAVSHQKVEVVKMLLECGANPNIRAGAEECAPLHVACVGTYGPNAVEIASTNPIPSSLLRDHFFLNLTNIYSFAPISELLISFGADVNMLVGARETPLMWTSKSAELARLLVEHGADINARSSWGQTALYRAALYGVSDLAVLKYLLSLPNIDVNPTTEIGSTPLMSVCRMGLVSTVELLLQHPNINVNASCRTGDTALHITVLEASETKYPERREAADAIIRKLVGAGANVEAESDQPIGCTPFMAACITGDVSTAQALLDCGANPLPDALPEGGLTPLMMAARHDGFEKVLSVILKHSSFNPLFTSSDSVGMTALHLAASKLRVNNIKMLIEAGIPADYSGPERPSQRVPTPLMLVASKCHSATAVQCVKLLIEAGADVNASRQFRVTSDNELVHKAPQVAEMSPLLIACHWSFDPEPNAPTDGRMQLGRCPTIMKLLEAGAKPDPIALRIFIDTFPFDSWPFRVRHEVVEVVKTFLSAGVDLNAQQQDLESQYAKTPLAAALNTRSIALCLELTTLLCEGGAKIAQSNGVDMLEWAVKNNICNIDDSLGTLLCKFS